HRGLGRPSGTRHGARPRSSGTRAGSRGCGAARAGPPARTRAPRWTTLQRSPAPDVRPLHREAHRAPATGGPMVTQTGAGGLRVVFFGTPTFAATSLEALLASRHEVIAVVTQPDRPRGRGQRVQPSPVKALALAAEVPVHQPTRLKDEAWLDQLRALAPDLGVVAAYGRLLPDV